MSLRHLIPARLVLVLLLAACNGPPNESDIRSALQDNLEQTIRAGETLEGSAWAERARQKAHVFSVKRRECVEEKPRQYRCDVTVDWETGLGPRKTEELRPIFRKLSRGWVIGEPERP